MNEETKMVKELQEQICDLEQKLKASEDKLKTAEKDLYDVQENNVRVLSFYSSVISTLLICYLFFKNGFDNRNVLSAVLSIAVNLCILIISYFVFFILGIVPVVFYEYLRKTYFRNLKKPQHINTYAAIANILSGIVIAIVSFLYIT